MKIDKELLLKHKFWVLLLITIPLSVFAIFVLLNSVSAEIAQKRKTIQGKIEQFGKVKNPPTQGMIKEKREIADKLKQEEATVHKRAFDEQKIFYVWPKEIEDTFDFSASLFAYHIKVHGKADDKKPSPTEPAPKEDRVVHGKVTVPSTKDYFEVEDATDKKVYKFYRTQNLKITPPGEPTPGRALFAFEDLDKDLAVSVYFNRGKYFMLDGLTDSEQSLYTKFRVYNSQILPVLSQVQPMDEKGNGVVQLKGWWFDENKQVPANSKFFTYVAGGWQNSLGKDISEEAWLAQEDIWIQIELYRLIRQANDYVSNFEGEGGADKNKSYTFKNPYWELAMKYPGGNKLNIHLKNLQNRRQKLDVQFKIRFDKTFKPESVLVGGEPLGPRGTPEGERAIVLDLKDGERRTGIYGVEQVLTWETAAVKRIDQISIGSLASADMAHGHRTFPAGLMAFFDKDKKEAPPTEDKGKLDKGAPPGFNEDKQSGDKTTHGLNKKRYMEVTGQARRLPVALSLIVDQDHVDRVQMSFANSKLRFLMTQVLLNRYPASVRPQITIDRKGGKGGDSGGKAFEGDGGRTVTASAGGDDLEANVELVLYGIVTLYERYPARNSMAVEAKQP